MPRAAGACAVTIGSASHGHRAASLLAAARVFCVLVLAVAGAALNHVLAQSTRPPAGRRKPAAAALLPPGRRARLHRYDDDEAFFTPAIAAQVQEVRQAMLNVAKETWTHCNTKFDLDLRYYVPSRQLLVWNKCKTSSKDDCLLHSHW
jgi:hypothetical protein